MLMKADSSALVVVDVQQRLAPALHEPERVIENCARLMQGADILEIPLLVSEQYPKGLGSTVPEIARLAPEGATLSKLHFSCAADPDFASRFKALDRPQAIVCGMEAHVCVLQTAIGLKELGYDVMVVGDAVTSRLATNRDLALERMRAAGVTVVSTEMVLFEWMGVAGTPEFRAITSLIK